MARVQMYSVAGNQLCGRHCSIVSQVEWCASSIPGSALAEYRAAVASRLPTHQQQVVTDSRQDNPLQRWGSREIFQGGGKGLLHLDRTRISMNFLPTYPKSFHPQGNRCQDFCKKRYMGVMPGLVWISKGELTGWFWMWGPAIDRVWIPNPLRFWEYSCGWKY